MVAAALLSVFHNTIRVIVLLKNVDHVTFLLTVLQKLPRAQRIASLPLCVVHITLHNLFASLISPPAIRSTPHDDRVI